MWALCVGVWIKQFLEKVSKFSILHFNCDVQHGTPRVCLCLCFEVYVTVKGWELITLDKEDMLHFL